MNERYSKRTLSHAAELHRTLIAFDAHIDVLLESGTTQQTRETGRFGISTALRSGLSGAALTVHATGHRRSEAACAAARRELEARYSTITRMAAAHADRAAIARSPGEFRSIVAAGRFAIVISFQNATSIGCDLSALDEWAKRGVRMFAFNFIGNNQWGDSARPYPFFGGDQRWGGLSELGKAAVLRLNELGVIIDVSQSSGEALADVLATTSAPVVASHSAVRAIVDTDRNLTDAELHAIKGNGGVVHMAAFAPYLRNLEPELRVELDQLWIRYGLPKPARLSDVLSVNDHETAQWPEERFWKFLHEFHELLDLDHPVASVRDLVDAIDHAVREIGIDHVGIGSDFNHGGGVAGWQDVSETQNVTAELIERGYPDGDIGKLWGENFLRVWQEVVDRRRAGARLP